ncbi:SH3 domain-containing protein [Aureimonas glaciei]|uniref:SH3b domain-containing protein n=1 Tax=Aureimonas glaciei TaxID=1776957 RepID=A0A916XYV4_9HYPH|nr:SH3 domain-containing protein [Aureimonas glaciei]GGD20531.1 hypothetical protein GCM10011335_24290 [Aureimonas glaciei]
MSLRLGALLVAMTLVLDPAAAGSRIAGTVPTSAGFILVSDSGAFDRSCTAYVGQGNLAEVPAAEAVSYCACLSEEFAQRGLKRDALDFFARTYSDDLTTFIHEYPEGEAWMQESFAAETACQGVERAEPATGAETGLPRNAGSWGGIVRSGPGQQYKRLDALPEGARVTLLENSSVMENGFPWMKISFGEGRTGYQWGGILCSIDTPMPEVFEMCTK